MGKRFKSEKFRLIVKCIDCGKGIRHSQKGFTWLEEQRCPKCYMQKNGLEKVKINLTKRNYNVVYINRKNL